jgi:cobalt/nickel transport system permease protein
VIDSTAYRIPDASPVSFLKLAASLSVVLMACSLSWETWPIAGTLLAVTLAGLALADMPSQTLARRLTLFLPVLSLVALSIPLSQGFTLSWMQVAATIVGRGVISFLAGLWLIRVLPFDQLLVTLRSLRLPAVVVASLAMMHRYLFVLWEEIARLKTARRARSLGHANTITQWMAGVALVGTLVIRSLDRGHRIHRAMLARGWDGHIRS